MIEIFEQIDKDELTRLAMDLVNLPSPTGEEGLIARFIVNWLNSKGIPAVLQEIESGRYNAVGRIEGAKGGCSLSLNAHMDTAFSGAEEDRGTLGEIQPWDRPCAYLEEDRIPSPHTSMWNDNIVYDSFGIPSIKWGPSPLCGSRLFQTREDLWKAAKVYAATAVDVCSWQKNVEK